MKILSMKSVFPMAILLMIAVLSGCSSHSDPGPLKGKWHVTGLVDAVMEFRDGETETNKITEKCSYKVEGKKVLVTYESGMAKGMTQTYLFLNKDTVESPLGTMTRLK